MLIGVAVCRKNQVFRVVKISSGQMWRIAILSDKLSCQPLTFKKEGDIYRFVKECIAGFLLNWQNILCERIVRIMPKGPQGQKRPADTNACAVMVARIATGEIEEDAYVSSAKDNGAAGAYARAAKLSPDIRSSIARGAADKRWNKRSDEMTDDNQLLRSLFGHEEHGRVHQNVKFFRGSSDDISLQDFEEAAASAFIQVDSGMVKRDASFVEDFNDVAVADFIKAI